MSIILLLGFNLFVSSSVPLGTAGTDIPSGFSLIIGGKYKVDYDFIGSYYSESNYDINLYGIAIGKELMLGKRISILPEMGLANGKIIREEAEENGLFPILLVRVAYLFNTENSALQIGFSLREVFNDQVGADFIDFGIGFRM
jgi:hypothetical protein